MKKNKVKKFLEKNWFKVILLILITVGILSFVIGQYFYSRKQRAEILLLEQQSQKQKNKALLDDCLEDVYNDYLANWNKSCEELKRENFCALSGTISNPMNEIHQKAKDECHKKYPQE